MSLPVPLGSVVAGKYRLEDVLGERGMGTVAVATHLLLQERVAIKFLSRELSHRSDLVERFFREARAAIRIKSEHVARVMDVGLLDSGEPYLVLELLDGRDLDKELEARGVLPVEEVVAHGLQACEALAEAHLLGIVHRDLKPANLFLCRRHDGRTCLKILDFGIAKVGPVSSSTTRTDAVMGSPAYMSPEQIRATRDVDARSDIWSLGAVLFELSTGAPPFDGESAADVTANILRNDPPTPRSRRAQLPQQLEQVILRCLAKAREDRFGSVEELSVALRAVPLAVPAPEVDAHARTLASQAGLSKLATDATVEVQSRPRERGARWLWSLPVLALSGGATLLLVQTHGSVESASPGTSLATAPPSSQPVAASESPPAPSAVVSAAVLPPAVQPVGSIGSLGSVKSSAPRVLTGAAPRPPLSAAPAASSVAPPDATHSPFGGRK